MIEPAMSHHAHPSLLTTKPENHSVLLVVVLDMRPLIAGGHSRIKILEHHQQLHNYNTKHRVVHKDFLQLMKLHHFNLFYMKGYTFPILYNGVNNYLGSIYIVNFRCEINKVCNKLMWS